MKPIVHRLRVVGYLTPLVLDRRVLGLAWLSLAAAKSLFPAVTESASLARRLGMPVAAFLIGYWLAVAFEAAVGLGNLRGRGSLWPKLSFIAAGIALLTWLFVEPLRNSCVCIGELVKLGSEAKLVLILYLLTASYMGVARTHQCESVRQ